MRLGSRWSAGAGPSRAFPPPGELEGKRRPTTALRLLQESFYLFLLSSRNADCPGKFGTGYLPCRKTSSILL